MSFSSSIPRASAAALLCCVATLQAQTSDYVWKSNRSGSFSTAANWTPDNTPFDAWGNYIFQAPGGVADPAIIVYTDGTSNLYGLQFLSPHQSVHFSPHADGSFSVGEGGTLLFKDGGITVGASTHAVVSKIVGVHGTHASALRFSVGANGSLTTENWVSPAGKALIKTGEGTLFLNASTGSVANGASFNFQEGITELAEGATIQYHSVNPTPNPLSVFIGSATTSATLRGGGTIVGQVSTFGVTHSAVDLTRGSLNLSDLDATLGSTFRFDLDDPHTLSGTGSLTLGDAVFEFSGGVSDQIYTLFVYGDLDLDTTRFTIHTSQQLDPSFGDHGWLVDEGALQVRFAAIPEPSLFALGMAGLAIPLALYRRRRRLS
ncbi:MAG TPA: hypothetical protein VNQ90_06820 [Chthoniobacteraceae bacterium]|nr:hypothetical protein [Chthoniobacteraceae bacterium]